ncbi:hypothetical protein VPNG_06287 [Cytospora leucostoma]|uniref:Uncharacterized protein n=1 Tax=Cytospora leucostoma TaxID=1230097 RepID=A0A423X2B9_9PEZI|nr:hypothetical protein VPNG_06287 [Cytospora leucostoma]
MSPHVHHGASAFWLITDAEVIHSSDYNRGAYNDMIWNAACHLAGVDVLKFDAHIHYTGKDRKPRKTGANSAGALRKHRPGRKYPLDHRYAEVELPQKRMSLEAHFADSHQGASCDPKAAERRIIMEEETHERIYDSDSDSDSDGDGDSEAPHRAAKRADVRDASKRDRVRHKGDYEAVCLICKGTSALTNIKRHLQLCMKRKPDLDGMEYDPVLWYRRLKG